MNCWSSTQPPRSLNASASTRIVPWGVAARAGKPDDVSANMSKSKHNGRIAETTSGRIFAKLRLICRNPV
jgi:hypothetical protein